MSALPSTSASDLENAVVQSAPDLGIPGPDNDYGFGLVDVVEAYNFLTCPPGSPDTDVDGIVDVFDNSIEIADGPLIPDEGRNSQCDTDGDVFGNVCDPDFNNDGIADGPDFTLFMSVVLSASYPDQDLNGYGTIDTNDFNGLKSRLLQLPGPSALCLEFIIE